MPLPIATHTLFDTPFVSAMLRGFSRRWLRWKGWEVRGTLPPQARRSVFIAAPHTSNWDLPYTLMTAFVLGLRIHWLGKASLFRWPFGGTMRWLGGIAVDRSQPGGLVAAAAGVLAGDGPALQLVVPPEGTRGRTRHWKTGFWHIAREAKVPIVLAYMDYERRTCGLGPLFTPTDDVEADLVQIKRFYAPFKGRRPDQFEAG
jgi:1-acyl-sn-glycerol-3-phosphate acyltransferase